MIVGSIFEWVFQGRLYTISKLPIETAVLPGELLHKKCEGGGLCAVRGFLGSIFRGALNYTARHGAGQEGKCGMSGNRKFGEAEIGGTGVLSPPETES
jgi:hypothetical protein